jgi:hypothetical protein
VPGVSPSTPGTLRVTGNYTQNSGGKLQIDVASSAGSDKLEVLKNITLAGTLEVSLAGGYVPHGTHSFDVLDWTGTLSGMFSSIQLPTLDGALAWDTSQLYTDGILTVIGEGIDGDFNRDGIVDGGDYVMWRKGWRTIFSGTDYNTWRQNFGNVAANGLNTTIAPVGNSVPEPSPNILLVFIVGLGHGYYGRPQKHRMYSRSHFLNQPSKGSDNGRQRRQER